jgi:hypothetical protein
MAWGMQNPTYDPGGFSDEPMQSSWEAPQSNTFDWGKLGASFLSGMAPTLASTGFGALMNQLMPGQPGKNRLVGTRTPQQQGAQQMGFDRLSSLQNNPSNFGLPGDASDINTPAGRRRWDIVNQSRSADAGRGMFSTGGSAQRETDALNRAQGADYNSAWNSAAQASLGGPGMSIQSTPAQPNPWAGLIAGGAAPGIQSGVSNLLKMWGLA